MHRHELPGVLLETRMARHYPFGTIAAHALGYVGTISDDDMQRVDRERYFGTGVIGKTGVERAYEDALLGTGGYREVLVNAEGRPAKLPEGVDAQLKTRDPIAGKDLRLTIDIELQRVAEEAFAGRRGGVVAIDPTTGDVLVFASLPSFDPNGFARGISRSEYLALTENPDQPLFNRVMRGTYPPGSTVKPLMALAGLEYDVIKPEDHVYCRGSYSLPGIAPPLPRLQARGPRRDGHGERRDAVLRRVLLPAREHARHRPHPRLRWRAWASARRPASTSPGERGGIMPSPAWKKGAFPRKEQQVWFPGETVIVGIGQGYWTATLLQLAKATALLATRGQPLQAAPGARARRPRHEAGGRPQARAAAAHRAEPPGELGDHRERDGQGDERPARHGDRASAAGATYSIAGKTGTAQVFSVGQTEKYNEKDVTERAARPRALHRLRAGGEAPARGRRAGRERRLRRVRGGADRARDLRRLPREGSARNRGAGTGGAPVIYGELGDSRTRRTVTGMARLLQRAASSTACCSRASSP